jgi:hypothetical protein
MATFTSVTSGNWNDGATWGKASPGVKGVDWPGNAGDVVNIGTTANQTHVVVYNVSETNELGQITIGATSGTGASRLEFSRSMNTKLTLGHQDIVCQLTGELRVGTAGAIIPKDYTAELIWNTTGDNAKGINVAAGGKLNIYGDPDYFGSDYDTVLVSQAVIPAAGNSVTITVAGDFTTKWIAGQELLVHKGGAYASYINDFCRLAITSVATNGADTDVVCTVTERPAALTCLVGADVLHLSRNVMFYKLGYNANLSQSNTFRPRLANGNLAGTSNINCCGVSFGGWYTVLTGYGIYNDCCVYRNGFKAMLGVNMGILTNIIAFANNHGTGSGQLQQVNASMVTGYIVNTDARAIYNCIAPTFGTLLNPLNMFGHISPMLNSYLCKGNIFSYSNSIGLSGYMFNCVFSGSLGYDRYGNTKANTVDANLATYGSVKAKLLNFKSIVGVTRNATMFPGRLAFEHYNQVVDAHYIADEYGDIYKTPSDGTGDNPTQRSGGSANVCEVTPQSNCSAMSYLELLNVRLWATTGVSKTYRFYVQTAFVDLTTDELKLYGEYLDEVSGGHLATVSSTQHISTRSNASDWSQYVEVTINPAQDGYVNLYLRLMGYESGMKVWVDPKPEGVAMTPRWSYGEVVLEPIIASGGGSVSPTNLGLVPLGIKQVAI